MEPLTWAYLLNLVFLICHEMDSAYWEEWKIFRLPGGITFFLLLHFPLFSIFLYGLIMVHEEVFAGMVLSLLLALAGLFAFCAHTFFILRGRNEFRSAVSVFILGGTLILSVIQLALTAPRLLGF